MAEKAPASKMIGMKKENSASRMQKAEHSPSSGSPVERILFLQRTIGNLAVQRLMRSGSLQAKLRISTPGDAYEQEADRVAEQVIRIKDNEHFPSIIPVVQPLIQRQEKKTEEPWYRVYTGTETNRSDDYVIAGISQKIGNVTSHRVDLVKPGAKYTPPKGWDLDCFIYRDGTAKKFGGFLGIESEFTADNAKSKFPQYIGEAARLFRENPKPKKETQSVIQRVAKSVSPLDYEPSILDEAIFSNSGRPLPESVRAFFEPRFGHDFSGVRVHTDAKAAEAARAVNARAFTVGRDIVLGEGEYGAGADRQRLMAHELTHVMQQKTSDFKSIQFKEKEQEQDKVEQYIAAAKEAVTYTQKILYLGMANPWNKWEDPRNIERYKLGLKMYGFDREGNENRLMGDIGITGAAFIPELILTARRMAELPDDNLLKDQIEEARKNGDLQKIKQLQIKTIERTARLGEELGFGNCSEHASISYLYLRNRGTPRPIEMLFTSDHAFVAIGRLAINSSNPKDWNPDTVICDAYYDEVYSLKDGILHERQAGVEKTLGRLED